jgi:hypothetical protein
MSGRLHISENMSQGTVADARLKGSSDGRSITVTNGCVISSWHNQVYVYFIVQHVSTLTGFQARVNLCVRHEKDI